MAEAHRPVVDILAETASCADCRWRQALDEDLHLDRAQALLDWHRDHPGQAVDHLAPDGLAGGLQVPSYVRWLDDGTRRLVVGDERTGGADRYNEECLAIMASVTATHGLEQAVAYTARRQDTSPAKAREDIVLIAASLYRKGLLRPADGTA
jgi:hypothetical protein